MSGISTLIIGTPPLVYKETPPSLPPCVLCTPKTLFAPFPSLNNSDKREMKKNYSQMPTVL